MEVKSELRNVKRPNNSDHTQEKKNSKNSKKKNNQAINTNPLLLLRNREFQFPKDQKLNRA